MGDVTNQMPGGGRNSRTVPQMPRGEVVATFATYPEAQAAVDELAKADFPVRQLSIVGSDLKTVESVTGKLSYGRGALAGAISGAWLGLFLGLLLVIFSPAATSVEFIGAAVLIGAGFGMLFGIVSYAVNRRRRDFTSTMQVIATSYAIIADSDVANKARNIVAPGGAWGAAAGFAVPQSAPQPVQQPDASPAPMPDPTPAAEPGASSDDQPRHPSDPPPPWQG